MARSGFAKEHLRSFIERIQRLEEEKAALAADIKEVYGEAKGTGFDTKILRKVVAILKIDLSDWREQEAILDLYLAAVGRGRDDGDALREVEAALEQLIKEHERHEARA